MNTSYRVARLMDAEELTIMSMELYNEVVTRKNFTENRIVATIRFYEENQNMGEVVMIESDGSLAGYSVIFKFWSNEYGGLLIGIDELYIKRSFRKSGIARAFIHLLISQNTNLAGIELECHPSNIAANRFYKSLGFAENENASYIKIFRSLIP